MTTDIVAPEGSAMSFAVIGVADMERSLHFYRDLTGMTASAPATWSGPDFETFWHLPKGSRAQAVFLHAGPDPVGRVLLLQFDAATRRVVRAAKPARAYGLINLNFYTDDIFGETAKFRKLGYEFWSDPVAHDFTADVGTPIEVVFEGPDGVLINWVELATTDPATRIGKMRAYVEGFGRTKTGFTPVVTSASCMRDIEKSKEFYVRVLKMGVHINQVLDSDNYRKFQKVPDGGRTQVTFMQGNHMFGKIATSQPLNYPVPDLVPDSVAPNIGYLMQSFLVPDLDAALADCAALSVETYTPRMTLEVPGLARVDTAIVRNPGSGALQQLVQA
ncbi:MAG: VOC family protein [Proteobacteria bacterium]|nr:VOC family protein [Pseudomonadota bacterium]MDA1059900.1 VOC family protein [Pseudomonadota bacterium]